MLLRDIVVLVACFSAPILFAQEGTDQLKANSDKAQQVFDNTIAKPGTEEQVPKEELPVYPGGESGLQAFLVKETRYPEEAREQGITGKVFVQFIVEKDGNVDSVWVKRGAHPLLDAEAMRVVQLADGWKPATQNNKPVRVTYMLPISFTMPAEDLEKIRRKAAKRAAKEKKD
jgi:TonB family protein